jgi:hypothetical protein
LDARDIYEHPHTKNGPSRKKTKTKTKKTKKRESVAYIYITHTRRFFAGREFFVGFFVCLWSAKGISSQEAGEEEEDAFVRALSAVRRRHLCVPGRETTTTTKKQPVAFDDERKR